MGQLRLHHQLVPRVASRSAVFRGQAAALREPSLGLKAPCTYLDLTIFVGLRKMVGGVRKAIPVFLHPAFVGAIRIELLLAAGSFPEKKKRWPRNTHTHKECQCEKHKRCAALKAEVQLPNFEGSVKLFQAGPLRASQTGRCFWVGYIWQWQRVFFGTRKLQ